MTQVNFVEMGLSLYSPKNSNNINCCPTSGNLAQ